MKAFSFVKKKQSRKNENTFFALFDENEPILLLKIPWKTAVRERSAGSLIRCAQDPPPGLTPALYSGKMMLPIVINKVSKGARHEPFESPQ